MASTNTITDLIPTLHAGLNQVSREQTGFIQHVTRDSNADRVALNQSVNVPVVGAITPVSITPSNTSPDTGGAAPSNVAITISNQYAAPIAWNGDEEIAVSEAGMLESVMGQRIMQGIRGIVNLVEADLAALHILTSRAYGTYNVQPFGTAGDLSDLSQVKKILIDNGAPQSDLRAILSSTAVANMQGKQNLLSKVNESGTDNMLRRGIMDDIFGIGIGASAQVKENVTVGTNNGAAQTNAAGYAVGAVTITLDSAGTGTIIAGDIITFAGDTNKYVVATGDANVSNGGTIVLQEPGLRQAIPASATVITTIAATDRNMVFSKSAIVLATRTPYMPKKGDMAQDVTEIVDPISGLAFQVAYYPQYRQGHFEIALAWGVKMIAPRHTALLIG